MLSRNDHLGILVNDYSSQNDQVRLHKKNLDEGVRYLISRSDDNIVDTSLYIHSMIH